MDLRYFDSLGSTNQYCELLDPATVGEFTVVWAREQTAGIGQRGNRWNAEPGKNITFSLVLKPVFLPMEDQYMLTKAVSLGIADWLDGILPHGQRVRIKWPNDIYVGDKKICGVLISTRVQRSRLAAAIVGVGLNVNQTVFPDWVPNPTSLSLLTGREYELEPLLRQLLACIERRYNELKAGLDPEPEYLEHLLNLGLPARYRYNEEEIEATITGVDPHGRLLLTAEDGRRLSCGMKEIAFIL